MFSLGEGGRNVSLNMVFLLQVDRYLFCKSCGDRYGALSCACCFCVCLVSAICLHCYRMAATSSVRERRGRVAWNLVRCHSGLLWYHGAVFYVCHASQYIIFLLIPTLVLLLLLLLQYFLSVFMRARMTRFWLYKTFLLRIYQQLCTLDRIACAPRRKTATISAFFRLRSCDGAWADAIFRLFALNCACRACGHACRGASLAAYVEGGGQGGGLSPLPVLSWSRPFSAASCLTSALSLPYALFSGMFIYLLYV